MNFLKKIQQKPERERKLILWITITIIGVILLYLWWILFKKETRKMLNSDTFEKINSSSKDLKDEYQKIKSFSLFSKEEIEKKIHKMLMSDTANEKSFLKSSLEVDTENTSKNIKMKKINKN